MIVEDHPGTIDSLPERYMMNTQIAKANAIKMESVPNDMANFNGFLEKPKIPAEAGIFRSAGRTFVTGIIERSLFKSHPTEKSPQIFMLFGKLFECIQNLAIDEPEIACIDRKCVVR